MCSPIDHPRHLRTRVALFCRRIFTYSNKHIEKHVDRKNFVGKLLDGFVRIQNYLFVTRHNEPGVRGCDQSDELISKTKCSPSLVLNYFREKCILLTQWMMSVVVACVMG
jgi:hypothetical protein